MVPAKRVAASALAVLALGGALTGAAQESSDALDADACVAAATADWSLPQTLEEVIALQEALAELVADCEAEAGAETEGADDETSDAEGDFPRRMYVTSRVPRINVRREPSTSSEVVATLAFAAPVEVLERVEGDSYRENVWWYRTEAGYIHSLLLGETKPAPLPTPIPTPLPVTAPQQQEGQDNQPQAQQQSQQQQRQQQSQQQQQERQGNQQRSPQQQPPDDGSDATQQPAPEDQPPPDEETGTSSPDSGQGPEGPLIFVPLTEEEWDEARRRLFGDDD